MDVLPVGKFFQFIFLWNVVIICILAVFFALTAIFKTSGPLFTWFSMDDYLDFRDSFLFDCLWLHSVSRRLHDTGKGSDTLLLFFVPL